MKRLSKISVVLLISLLCILGLSTTAFAEETQSSDGLQASIVTNSDEYKTNDDIKVEVKVKNTNDFDINGVSMNTVVPNGLTVKDNASTSKTVGTLKGGKEESYSIILNVKSTSSGIGTASTSPQTGNTVSTSATTNSESSVGTGDARNIAVLVIVLVGSATLMIYNRKKLSKHISIMLCFAICLTSIAAVGISSANAAEQSNFTVNKTIKIDDKNYTIGLSISYDKESITNAVNLTGYKMSEASGYIDNDLYADVEDLSHVEVDSDTLISYFDNEVSFMVKDGVTERDVVDNVINKYDAIIVGKSSATGRYLIRFKNDTYTYDEILKIQDELSKNPLVEAAYPDYAIELEYDAFYPKNDLWDGMYDVFPDGENWGIEAIKAPEVWDYYDLMSSVNIGIFDSGIEYSHSDLKNVIINVATNKAAESHGTHVAGIIGAEFNNGVGINGVSPTAKLSCIEPIYAKESNIADKDTDDYRFISANYPTDYDITNNFHYCNAYEYLIDRCNSKVVNMSMGFKNTSFVAALSPNSQNDKIVSKCKNMVSFYSIPIQDTLRALLENNKEFVICVAAGNSSGEYFIRDDSNKFGYRKYTENDNINDCEPRHVSDSRYSSALTVINDPELTDRIIVVGNAETDGFDNYSLHYSSCMGDRVDVVAPGTNIESTLLENNYGLMSGTSMSSPHVAGIAGILFSLDPEIDGKSVKRIICDSADIEVAPNYEEYNKNSILYDNSLIDMSPKKMVNAEAAVKMLLENENYAEPCKYSYERTVVDQNNNPVPDVKVTVTSYFKSGAELNHQDITTNSNGIFKFSEYAGKGKITLEKDGYETVTIEDNFEKGAIYVNKYPVTMKKIVDDKQYTASELVNRDLYDILAELGDDYTLEDNYAFISIKYPKYNLSIVTDIQRNVSTPNELADPISESDKKRFNEAIKNKTAKLSSIIVTSDGKLDDNIDANMRYNNLTPYYGDFDCGVYDVVDIANPGHSKVYGYEVVNESGKTIAIYSFDVDENAELNYSGETAESMKKINPKLYKIRVYPGYDGYFKPTSTDWANAYADYIQTNKGNDDIKFALGYVDNDNVPELFITRGGYHALGVEFYTYKDGNVVKLGNSGSIGSNGTAAYAPKQSIIHGGHVGMGANMGQFDELSNGVLTRRISYIHYDEDINSPSKGKYYFDNNEDYKTSDDEEVTEKEYFNTVDSYINNYNYVAIGWDSAIKYAVDTTINELRKNPYIYLNPDEVNSNFLSYDEVIYEVINSN